jgi:hypothetical protein
MNLETCEPQNRLPCQRINGDTKWKNYDPSYAMEMFIKTGGGSERHHRNQLTENFFSTDNVLFITQQIAKVLKELTGGQNVNVPFNDELVQTMWEVAKSNIGLTYVPGAVAILNRAVVEHEANVLYNSLIRRKLWIKYYLKQDRMKVFPYGQLTKQTKGEEIISPSGYMLSNPWARHRNSYLETTEGLRCDNLGEYQPIPGFLEPKIKPPGPARAAQPPYRMNTQPLSPSNCPENPVRHLFH